MLYILIIDSAIVLARYRLRSSGTLVLYHSNATGFDVISKKEEGI
ncbi:MULTISPECIES: hypothetical protein [unclassified Tychonema]|nr:MULTISPECIES: hypothetical protein [unclassified Tychonema]